MTTPPPDVPDAGLVRLADDVRLPHLRAFAGDIAPRVLVVGDPARARRAGELLDDAREVGSNREYVTLSGTYGGQSVSVCSHGVGSAGAAICFEELARAGASRMVRAGTAGGMQPGVRDGAVVVGTAAVRDEGVTPRLVPLGFPAAADPDLTRALVDAAADCGVPVHTGVVLTSDTFYPLPVLGDELALWARAGCVAVEMELSVLLVLGALHGFEAGGVFAIDGNPLAAADTAMSGYDPDRDVVARAVDAALTTALRALVAT